MDGIIVLSYYNLHIEEGMDRVTAVLHTCRVQMRPVMMTCVVACVGLVPAALSTGNGSQVQRPLALVVVGGMLLTPILVLLVLPVLILLFSRRMPSSEETAPAEALTFFSLSCLFLGWRWRGVLWGPTLNNQQHQQNKTTCPS